jgi:IS605 OrfB family transposase
MSCARDALWATHEAVNKGAKVFGEWLLTLRGGLDRRLADEKVKTKAKPVRDPTPEERKNRRILLVLSWLSVEDALGAPRDEALIVAKGTESTDARERKLADALAAILQARGVEDAERRSWLADCLPSLRARIRDDAVWVNRSAAFDNACKRFNGFTPEDVWDMLEPFFTSQNDYMEPAESKDSADDDIRDTKEKAKDLVQKAGQWLSSRFGTGKGADFEQMSRVYAAMAKWAERQRGFSSGAKALDSLGVDLANFNPGSRDAQGILKLISGPGYKSATRNIISNWGERASPVTGEDIKKLTDTAKEDAAKCRSNIGSKGRRPYSYSDAILKEGEHACGFTYQQTGGPARHSEFAVMLEHAARRVSIVHSWIKRAEAQRRQFESDAQRRNNIPRRALDWLEDFCKERGSEFGSLEGYRIRKRAIEGWEKVVERWSRADCQTADDRIAAARQLQDDPEIDKFGDIQLFEALADADALCVWKPDGTPTAQPLKDFVAGTEAEAKKRRFKVPAYRHPDALRHPVFTDFGNSRWSIDFSVHRAPAKLGDLQQKVAKLKAALDDAERKLSNSTATQGEKRQQKVTECRDKLRDAEQEFEAIRDRQRLELKVWNGKDVEPRALRWSCKRLVADLGLRSPNGASSESRIGVSRADRLGRAALGADESSNVAITGLFEQDHWNGRLQAPRAQLDAIAHHVDKHGWDAKARAMIDHIRWLVSFSAELTQQGPWYEYVDARSDKMPFQKIVKTGARKGQTYVSAEGWPHSIINEDRYVHAKVILSRLPGLRVLSVDLGHRYAAACAVWEAITQNQMRQACQDAGVSSPDAGSMYVHLQRKNSAGKPITAIYRRIGPDVLADNSPHPAPWARLERQFLIKLQGEEREARKASLAEIEAVECFEQWAGRRRPEDDPPRELAIDALMSDAVRTARLALARHGRRARIARDLIATVRTLPGGRQKLLDDTGRLDFLIETLADWHALASEFRWNDAPARELWNERLATLPGGFVINSPVASPQTEEKPTKAQRRQAEQELHDRLGPLAKALFADESHCQQLHRAWCARWSADDDQWKQKLKWLSRWLLPHGGPRHDSSRWHVGGLSLKRVGTLTEFRRKVQVGFFTRLWPNGSRAEIGQKFGQSTLNAIQRLKDQRIKQLASRIVEAALGAGKEQDRLGNRDPKRPRRRIDDPRFAPCHAVVIENLTNYRPEETRTRRENRATMDWKSAETRKRLADHCQLYGLHLRDVNPQYTSRQDSRTGAPGVRCVDVSVADFLTKPWWRKQVARARKKAEKNKGDARERYLIALDDKWSNASDNVKGNATPLRIPLAGGELFVSADPQSPLANGIQADLNAAANIGLRALLDPDFPGRWWYVPCSETDGIPLADKVKGSICFGDDPKTFGALSKKDTSSGSKSTKDIVNLWGDVSARPLRNVESGGFWLPTPAYWRWVLKRVATNLRKGNGLPEDLLTDDATVTPNGEA